MNPTLRKASAVASAAAALFYVTSARADLAPGPSEYAFLGFGALVMAVPGGMVLGSMIYMVIAFRQGDKVAEADQPMWRRRLWRRSIQLTVLSLFVGLVTLALVASASRRRNGWQPPPGSTTQTR
ncbi:MAG: hypothetical protein U0271_38680 [Polyangiaceae bacterium]